MNAINQNFTYLATLILPTLSGAGAPVGTPTTLGQQYIDTTSKNVYIAVGTSSDADWKLMAAF